MTVLMTDLCLFASLLLDLYSYTFNSINLCNYSYTFVSTKLWNGLYSAMISPEWNILELHVNVHHIELSMRWTCILGCWALCKLWYWCFSDSDGPSQLTRVKPDSARPILAQLVDQAWWCWVNQTWKLSCRIQFLLCFKYQRLPKIVSFTQACTQNFNVNFEYSKTKYKFELVDAWLDLARFL